MQKIRVIIADDHAIFLDGLRILLNSDPQINVIAEALNGKKLVQFASELQPDVVITDMRMPEIDGISAIRAIKQMSSNIKCIVLSNFDSDRFIVDALEAGASGYIIKNADKEEVIGAVKTVVEGYPYYCSSTSKTLAGYLARSRFNPYNSVNSVTFTEREKQVIHYICLGKTDDEIGSLIFQSGRTVERYRTTILRKMNIKNSRLIIIYAIKNGLFNIDDVSDVI